MVGVASEGVDQAREKTAIWLDQAGEKLDRKLDQARENLTPPGGSSWWECLDHARGKWHV